MMRWGMFFFLVWIACPISAQDVDRPALLAKMEKAMGPLPPSSFQVPLDVQVISEETLEDHIRRKVSFAVESGDRVPAWLLLPLAKQGKSIEGRRAAMLCLHQTIPIGKDEPIGLGVQESKRQALHLVRRGYVCLAPDYPSFGEYSYDFRKAADEKRFDSGTMKAIWNNMRAVDFLQSLPEVDPQRIGVIGHSLGGHNSLYTAAFDDRLQVAVTSCGFNSFHKYYGGNLKGWTSDRYMPRIASLYKNDPKQMPFDFDDVLLSIYPRAVFVMAPLHDSNFEVEGVYDVLKKVEPVYRNHGLSHRLQAVHPDAGHEWPESEREKAYHFIDSILLSPSTTKAKP